MSYIDESQYSGSIADNPHMTREEKLELYQMKKQLKKEQEKLRKQNKFNYVGGRRYKKKFENSLRAYGDDELGEYGNLSRYDSLSNSEILSNLGSMSKSQASKISRDQSFSSMASGFGSTKKNLLNRIDDLGLDGNKSKSRAMKVTNQDLKKSLNFDSEVQRNKPTLSVSKTSYTGTNNIQETTSLLNNRGKNRAPKLSLDKDFLRRQKHQERKKKTKPSNRKLRVISKLNRDSKENIDYKRLPFGLREDQRSQLTGDQDSLSQLGKRQNLRVDPINKREDSAAISVSSNTNKSVVSKMSHYSKYSRVSRNSIKSRISKITAHKSNKQKYTPSKYSARKIKLEQKNKKSIATLAKELYELYEQGDESWKEKFDIICQEHLGKLYTKFKHTAFMPIKIHRQSQSERLFFNKWKFMILYFERHKQYYKTREEVLRYFQFNKISMKINEFKKEYLAKHFPVTSKKKVIVKKKTKSKAKTPTYQMVETISDENCTNNNKRKNKISTTDRKEVTRKMEFPQKFQKIELNKLNLEEDEFELKVRDKDPYSTIKAENFTKTFTAPKDVEYISSEKIEQKKKGANEEDKLESSSTESEPPMKYDYNGTERVEGNFEDEFDQIIDCSSSFMSGDKSWRSRTVSSKQPGKSILKKTEHSFAYKTKQRLARELNKGEPLLSTGQRMGKKYQREKRMPARFNPILQLNDIKPKLKPQDYFLVDRRIDHGGSNYVEVTDKVTKKIKVVDIRPDLVEDMSEEDTIMGNPLVLKLPNPYTPSFEINLKKQRNKEDQFARQKKLTMKIIESVENLPFMSKDMPFDGASFYHYNLIPAPKDIQKDFGIKWIVKACKSSRRVFKNRGDMRLGRHKQFLSISDLLGRNGVVYSRSEIEENLPIDEGTKELKEYLKRYKSLEDFMRLDEDMDPQMEASEVMHRYTTVKKLRKCKHMPNTESNLNMIPDKENNFFNYHTDEDEDKDTQFLLNLGYSSECL